MGNMDDKAAMRRVPSILVTWSGVFVPSSHDNTSAEAWALHVTYSVVILHALPSSCLSRHCGASAWSLAPQEAQE